MGFRPKIPTKIKRRILLEAGYRCSIPTCRFPVTENAHIISWAKSKDHSYENLIALCPNNGCILLTSDAALAFRLRMA